jgi:5-methyltetrahydrofolate--homocysteine methyltransferase
MSLSFREMLTARIPVIYDGAMGTQLQNFTITPDDVEGHLGCNEVLNVRRPEIVRQVHGAYIDAGANVIETNTFGANRFKLAEYGLQERVLELNAAASRAARAAIEAAGDGRPLFVAGSMGPTGMLPSSTDPVLSAVRFDDLAAAFEEQAAGLLEGGADVLLLETMQDLLEVRAALCGIERLFTRRGAAVPVQVQVTLDATGHMLLGGDVRAFLAAVGNFGPAVVGFNCSTGPDEMRQYVEQLMQAANCPVAMQPNAGMPENVDGKATYRLTPEPFGQRVAEMAFRHGVAVVGGCCGTTPDHIRALARALAGKTVAPRPTPQPAIYCGSGLSGVDLQKAERPFIIGERLNAQGSKAAKELVLSENYEELYHLGLEQQEKKSVLLDLCLAVNETDSEAQVMERLVRYLAPRLVSGFCLDSTDPAVFAAGLRVSPASVMINSINLEKNGEKARRICRLAAEFHCPVIALPIDDEGMARTVERKLELARRLLDCACGEFGLPRQYVFFDPLVFTLATGDPASADAAVQSLEALRRLKQEFPGINTAMGVSNVSFGLKPAARRILNNLMLYHAGQAGLDAAIFNPLHVDDVSRYDADIRGRGEDLLLNRRPDALERFIAAFDAQQPSQKTGTVKPGPAESSLPLPEQLRQKVINRDRRKLPELIAALLAQHPAQSILDEMLLPAMAHVGDLMAKGEMILPFVLQAAEVMKESLTILEPQLRQGAAGDNGCLVLATVYGDIHDIGKNLVGSILRNQGFRVIDLGKQVPLEAIVEAVQREKPDAVGLSALLVTTSREMTACVKEFDRLGLTLPILIGGAAVNSRFAERIATLDDGRKFAGGVFFARDAFEAAKILKARKGTAKSPVAANSDVSTAVTRDHASAPQTDSHHRLQDAAVPTVSPADLLVTPFWGTGEMLTWESPWLLEMIDKKRLYKGYWRGGKLGDEEFERTVLTEFEPAFEQVRNEILGQGLVEARGYYGFFPVYAEGETLYLLDPSDFQTELASYHFPRSPRDGRCLTDYFVSSGDLIGVQVVTIGGKLGNRCRDYFQQEHKYSQGFYLNGVGNYLTEFLAERLTIEMRRSLFLPLTQGKRYSFGYPGMPGLEEQKSLFELLCAEERLAIKLTTGYQMDPEHSTIGIFIHHKGAQYFSE